MWQHGVRDQRLREPRPRVVNLSKLIESSSTRRKKNVGAPKSAPQKFSSGFRVNYPTSEHSKWPPMNRAEPYFFVLSAPTPSLTPYSRLVARLEISTFTALFQYIPKKFSASSTEKFSTFSVPQIDEIRKSECLAQIATQMTKNDKNPVCLVFLVTLIP